jgi:hypothetical protein
VTDRYLDDLIIPIATALVGLVPVGGANDAGGRFGASATIGLAMIALGVVGTAREAVSRRRRLPDAIARGRGARS